MRGIGKNTQKGFLFIIVVFMIALLTDCDPPDQQNRKELIKDISKMENRVFTTAHHSNLKLTPSESIVFEELKQPLETEANIVVNPKRQFQTFLGIGAALTDASAEKIGRAHV